MEFDGELISFNIFEAMRYPSDIHSWFTIDIINTLVQEVCQLKRKDALELVLTKKLEVENLKKHHEGIYMSENIKEIIAEFESLPPIEPRYDLSYIALPLSKNKILPSIVPAPILELKALPSHLKYIYMGDEETLLIIVAKNLSSI